MRIVIEVRVEDGDYERRVRHIQCLTLGSTDSEQGAVDFLWQIVNLLRRSFK